MPRSEVEREFDQWRIATKRCYSSRQEAVWRAAWTACTRRAVEICRAERRDDGTAQRIEAAIEAIDGGGK